MLSVCLKCTREQIYTITVTAAFAVNGLQLELTLNYTTPDIHCVDIGAASATVK